MPQIYIDRRILRAFMTLMVLTNAAVFLILWKDIRAGKNDFPIFYSNAQMVREGQASRLYDYDAENSFIRRVSDVPRVRLNHVPYELLFFIPFTYLRFVPAFIVWTFLGLVMLGAVVLLMRDPQPGVSNFAFTYLMALSFFPVWYCLLMGHDSILLLFLFALSYCVWKQGQDDMAGFILALGLFRPQLVLPFVFVVFLAGKWKFVRGFIPGAVLMAGLSTWVVGLHGVASYIRILLSLGTEKSSQVLADRWTIQPEKMATWRGFLTLCLPTWAPTGLRNFLVVLGTFAGLLWAAKRMRNAKSPAAFDLVFGVAVAVITLVSFHSFLNDFSLMIIPLLIAGSVVSTLSVAESEAYLIVTLGFIFLLSPVYLALLWSARVGLFFLPAAVAVWLMSRWETGRPSEVMSVHRSPEQNSLQAV
jgi:Glycosyltransferase family 87